MFIRPPRFSSTRLGSPFPLRFASACALVFTQFRASHRRFIRLFPRLQRRNFAPSYALNLTAEFNLTTKFVFTAEARRRGGILPSLLRSSAYSAASVFQRFWVLPFQ